MDDDSDVIRQEMEETKSQLSEKLESLEIQIAETMQSTGTAVNATVEAVQETAEAVTEVVQDAAHSLSNAFDLRRQIDRHPWLVLGGAVALGYLANELLTVRKQATEKPLEGTPIRHPSIDAETQDRTQGVGTAAATRAAVTAAYESGRRNSAWGQLRDVAMGAMISVVQEAVSRSVPSVLDYLIGTRATTPEARITDSENINDISSTPPLRWSPEAKQRLRVASSGKVRTDDSFY
jgi:hypothetical protein